MEKFVNDLAISAAFGTLGIALAIIGFKVFEWVTPKINVEQELAEKQNTAVAIVAGALILGICYVVAHVVH